MLEDDVQLASFFSLRLCRLVGQIARAAVRGAPAAAPARPAAAALAACLHEQPMHAARASFRGPVRRCRRGRPARDAMAQTPFPLSLGLTYPYPKQGRACCRVQDAPPHGTPGLPAAQGPLAGRGRGGAGATWAVTLMNPFTLSDETPSDLFPRAAPGLFRFSPGAMEGFYGNQGMVRGPNPIPLARSLKPRSHRELPYTGMACARARPLRRLRSACWRRTCLEYSRSTRRCHSLHSVPLLPRLYACVGCNRSWLPVDLPVARPPRGHGRACGARRERAAAGVRA